MIAVGQDARRLSIESADETACGDEYLTGHVVGEVARQIGVNGGGDRAVDQDVDATLTTTPAPFAVSNSATANPMPRDPPTTTAAVAERVS
jgi:hypothetical protein